MLTIRRKTHKRRRPSDLTERTDEMIRKSILAALVALGLGATGVMAQEGEVTDYSFSFEGPFGTYDKAQLQRGLQVFTEVCAACHGVSQLYFRNLSDPGGPELTIDQVKAYAKEIEVYDKELDDTRPAKPSDQFPPNTDAGAPDLSLMAKARAGFHGPMGLGINQLLKGMGGPEYIASILTGFTGETKEEGGSTFYENKTFPSGWMKMPPPLEDGLVEYADGSPNDVVSMAKDVSAFLMWVAEPKMTVRKKTGFVVIAFLVLLTSLLYLTNKKLWAGPKRKG